MEDLRPKSQKINEQSKSEVKKLGFFKRIFLWSLFWIKNYKKTFKKLLWFIIIIFILLNPKTVGSFIGNWYKNITDSFIENIK